MQVMVVRTFRGDKHAILRIHLAPNGGRRLSNVVIPGGWFFRIFQLVFSHLMLASKTGNRQGLRHEHLIVSK